jgi:hypothetical protein
MAAKTTIVVNGVEYSSADEMPPEIRSQYERVAALLADRDRNGIPDLVERPGGLAEALEHLPRGTFSASSSTQHWVVNGEEYGSLADVPAALRGVVQRLTGDRVVRASDAPRPAKRATPSLRLPVEDQPRSMLGPLLIGLLAALAAVIALGIVPAPRF